MERIDKLIVHGGNCAASLHITFDEVAIIYQSNTIYSGNINKTDSGIGLFQGSLISDCPFEMDIT